MTADRTQPETVTQLQHDRLDPSRLSLWSCGKCKRPIAQVCLAGGSEVRIRCGSCGEFNTLQVR